MRGSQAARSDAAAMCHQDEHDAAGVGANGELQQGGAGTRAARLPLAVDADGAGGAQQRRCIAQAVCIVDSDYRRVGVYLPVVC